MKGIKGMSEDLPMTSELARILASQAALVRVAALAQLQTAVLSSQSDGPDRDCGHQGSCMRSAAVSGDD